MFPRYLRSAAAAALISATLAAAAACAPTSGSPPPPVSRPQITPMTDISAGCGGNSSEVEEAFAPPRYVYAEWIGCGGIGFARSTDSGEHFGAAMTVPGSEGPSWDPAITVGAGGTVYAAFMHASGRAATRSSYPVVAVSGDHGASFTQVHQDRPRRATGATGTSSRQAGATSCSSPGITALLTARSQPGAPGAAVAPTAMVT